MTGVDDHLPRTRRLAAALVGRRLTGVLRLLDVEPEDDDLRREWGPLLLELAGRPPVLADVDEAKANLLLFELPTDTAERERSLADVPVRLPIAWAGLPAEPIETVEEISRAPDPTWEGAFELSGLRLTLSDGTQALVGTHLTSLPQPGVWLLAPAEADSALRYTPVRAASATPD